VGDLHHLKRANCDDDTVAYDLLVPERDQLSLLPPSMVDWLPEDHLTCFVLDAVEEMDLSPFYGDDRDDGRGGGAHRRQAMVALLLPDHTAIARFGKRHDQALKQLFIASLRLCATAGMALVGLVAFDGTKMAANASMQANRTKETVDQEVEKMFAEADAADEAEDAVFGEARGDEPPAVLRGRTPKSPEDNPVPPTGSRRPTRPTPAPR